MVFYLPLQAISGTYVKVAEMLNPLNTYFERIITDTSGILQNITIFKHNVL